MSIAPRAAERPGLAELASALRHNLSRAVLPSQASSKAADALSQYLPSTEILTEQELGGDPEGYQQHILHVEPDGAFSVVALVWQPGQETPIHDHVSWCVVGVVEGAETEVTFKPVDDGEGLALIQVRTEQNLKGSVSALSPPSDIHKVRNSASSVAVSIHVYGADISRLGSSIRRRYDYPVLS